jgi:hypothetical protein
MTPLSIVLRALRECCPYRLQPRPMPKVDYTSPWAPQMGLSHGPAPRSRNPLAKRRPFNPRRKSQPCEQCERGKSIVTNKGKRLCADCCEHLHRRRNLFYLHDKPP